MACINKVEIALLIDTVPSDSNALVVTTKFRFFRSIFQATLSKYESEAILALNSLSLLWKMEVSLIGAQAKVVENAIPSALNKKST